MRAVMLLCALLVACGPVASGTGSTGGPSIDAGTDTDAGIDGGRPIQQFGLSIGVNGQGAVQSSPAGISCGQICAASFDEGTSVSLTAAPASGFRFDGWGGACSGPGGCAVTMDREQVVAVRFQPVAPPPQKLAYTITEIPGVEGNSSLMPSGIDSRGDLVGSYWITNGSIVDAHAFF